MVSLMRPISLLYHDVVHNGNFDASGFQDPLARRYKIDFAEFVRHLSTIYEKTGNKPITATSLLERRQVFSPLLLTFDDGGSSFYYNIASALEKFGWCGNFFVTANYIEDQSFVTRGQIIDLHKRGHIIGTHSFSHPKRMSKCSWHLLLKEWGMSVEILSDILNEQVVIGSVPGGYYTRKVARAASAVGIKILFTSEPTTKCHRVDNCLVLGRYTLLRGMSANYVAKIASGNLSPRLMQFLYWNANKVIKALTGRHYMAFKVFISKNGLLKSSDRFDENESG